MSRQTRPISAVRWTRSFQGEERHSASSRLAWGGGWSCGWEAERGRNLPRPAYRSPRRLRNIGQAKSEPRVVRVRLSCDRRQVEGLGAWRR
jgi:hypothetical protein